MFNHNAPPSPSSPFSPHTPGRSNAVASSSYQTIATNTGIQRQQPHYMSPSYHEHVSSASPAILNAAPVPHPEEHHVKVLEVHPIEGAQGTQMTIKCDVNFPPSPPASHSGNSPPDNPASQGRALRVVFGTHPVQTQVMVLNSANVDGGQTCQLNAAVPSWSSTGAATMGRGSKIPVYVQVLDGSHAIVETIWSGDFTYNNMAAGPRREQDCHASGQVVDSIDVSQPTYATNPANPLKRSGEALESHRPSPAHMLHRRVLSNTKFDSPSEVQFAPPPLYTSNPGEYRAVVLT